MISYSQLIPITSLIIAGLAVFFGPLISLLITKRTLKLNLKLTKKSLISPLRQEWINNLRDTITEFIAKCVHYNAAGTEDRKDSEYYRLTELEYKIQLLINPEEPDHSELIDSIHEMTDQLYIGNFESDKIFWQKHNEIIDLSQNILKREWERVKHDDL